jgi:polynucleotide 5'-kinase involved in rRNA processing
MPFNLIRKYPDILDIRVMSETERRNSLRGVFDRDITNNPGFSFLGKKIYPIKTDGIIDMDREFMHVTTERIEVEENGRKFYQNVFEFDRSERLHWIKTHTEGQINDSKIVVFSVNERDKEKRKDVPRTYLYNQTKKYVIVFEPLQRNGNAYFLITAYYLNKEYGVKIIEKKLQKRLDIIL